MARIFKRKEGYFFPLIIAIIISSGSLIFAQRDSIEINVESLQEHRVYTNNTEREIGLNEKDWDKNKQNSLAESVEDLSGFSKRSMGSAPARPVYHGLKGSQVQIAEDNTPILDLSTTSPDHAVASPNSQVQSLKIISGAKLLSHSLSVEGVRLELNRNLFLFESPEEIRTQIEGQYLSNGNAYSFSIQNALPIYQFEQRESLSLITQASYTQSSDQESPQGEMNPSHSDSYDIAAGLQFENSFSKWSGALQSFSLDYGIPGGFAGGHADGVQIEMDKTQFRFGNELTYRGAQIISQFDFQKYFHREFENGGSVGAEFEVENFDVESKVMFTPFERHEFEFGVSLQKESRLYGGFVYTPNSIRNKFDLFLLDSWRTSDINTLRFGSRAGSTVDELSGFYAQRDGFELPERTLISYSAYLENELALNKKNVFVVGMYKTSRLPSLEELYNQGPHLAAYSYEVGNPNLNPESGYGANLKIQGEFVKVGFQAESYFTYYENLIYSRPNGETHWGTLLPIYQSAEGEALYWGASLGLDVSIWGDFGLRQNIEYTWAQDLKLNQPVSAIPPFRYLSELYFDNNLLSASLSGVFLAEQSRLSEFEQKTNSSWVMSSDLGYQFFWNTFWFKANIGIENIFDVTWRHHLSRVKEIYPEKGRSFKASLGMEF